MWVLLALLLLQVARLTEKIKAIAQHMRVHRKDYSSRRRVHGGTGRGQQRVARSATIKGRATAAVGPQHSTPASMPAHQPTPPAPASVACGPHSTAGSALLSRRASSPAADADACCACRGLEAMLTTRRQLLLYLRRTKFDTYAALISRLGLKDNYAAQDRYSSRYRAAAPGSAGAGSAPSSGQAAA